MRSLRRCLLPALVVACATAAPAQANIVAMADTQVLGGSTFNLDLIAVDTATGTRLNLPAGINTSADEFHPSVTSDGRFAVFQRHVFALGVSTRIIMVNLDTGAQADLFNGIESASIKPQTAAISPNGRKVIVGRDVRSSSSTGTNSKLVSVDVTNFPNGPFPKTDVPSKFSGIKIALTRNPSILNTDRFAWRTDLGEPPPPEGSGFFLTFTPGIGKFVGQGILPDHPELQPGNPGYSVYSTGGSGSSLVVADPDGNSSLLPNVVNTAGTKTRPSFEATGRYLGYIRQLSGDAPTVRVWDTTTQEIVNPGAVVGPSNSGSSLNSVQNQQGNLALFIPDPLIARFTCCRVVSFTTSGPTLAGLLVQRIKGSKRLLGKRVPKLKRVGRFPLGSFDKGKQRKDWDLVVRKRGKKRKLKPGCYLVTLRALTKNKKRVRELSKPYTLRVRKGKKPLKRKGVKRKLCRRD